MKVAELIAELQKLPQDLDVWMDHSDVPEPVLIVEVVDGGEVDTRYMREGGRAVLLIHYRYRGP